MNVATMDASTANDEALQRDTDAFKFTLSALDAAKLRTINAYAAVIVGDLERKYHVYRDPKVIDVSFVEYATGRTVNELISPKTVEFIKKNRRRFTTDDILGIQDTINEALQSRELIVEPDDGLNIMYAIGVCVDPFVGS